MMMILKTTKKQYRERHDDRTSVSEQGTDEEFILPESMLFFPRSVSCRLFKIKFGQSLAGCQVSTPILTEYKVTRHRSGVRTQISTNHIL